MPPPLPTAKSPELGKESGSTYAAGRTRVPLILVLLFSSMFYLNYFSTDGVIVDEGGDFLLKHNPFTC